MSNDQERPEEIVATIATTEPDAYGVRFDPEALRTISLPPRGELVRWEDRAGDARRGLPVGSVLRYETDDGGRLWVAIAPVLVVPEEVSRDE